MNDKQKELKPGCCDDKKNKPDEDKTAPGSNESCAMKNKRDKEIYQHDSLEADKDREETDPAVERKKGK